MNKMTKLKTTALVAIMLILSPTIIMAERRDHSNNHVSQARYNNNSHDKYDRRHDERHYYNKHNRHNEYRHYEKHAYKNWHRKHHNHYQPAFILLGLQGGNFSFILRD